MYCSDVSSAFDKVSRKRFVANRRAKGISNEFIAILDAWFQQRDVRVVVGGRYCEPTRSRNMIHRGPVWGQWLWNILYEDVGLALQVCKFKEILFADAINAYGAFEHGNSHRCFQG